MKILENRFSCIIVNKMTNIALLKTHFNMFKRVKFGIKASILRLQIFQYF
jgi:hypothetical protein